VLVFKRVNNKRENNKDDSDGEEYSCSAKERD